MRVGCPRVRVASLDGAAIGAIQYRTTLTILGVGGIGFAASARWRSRESRTHPQHDAHGCASRYAPRSSSERLKSRFPRRTGALGAPVTISRLSTLTFDALAYVRVPMTAIGLAIKLAMFRTWVGWLIRFARRLLGVPYAGWVFFAKGLRMAFVPGGAVSSQAEAITCKKDYKHDKREKILHARPADSKWGMKISPGEWPGLRCECRGMLHLWLANFALGVPQPASLGAFSLCLCSPHVR
jgi:hypothetical protein